MAGKGRRINIFIDSYQEEFLLRRAAEEQVALRRKVSPSEYLVMLIVEDMVKRNFPKSDEEAATMKRPRLRLPSSSL